MIVVGFWWQRHRWTLLFTALALALGGALGVLSRVLLALPPHLGSRPEFYLEFFFALIGALGLGVLLLVRAQLGLPILLALLTFLPSRAGMQLQFTGYVVLAAVDVAVLAGFLILLLHAKVLYKRRLRPVVLFTPLWAWVVVSPLGTLVAVARGVPWANWLPELKGFYFWIPRVFYFGCAVLFIVGIFETYTRGAWIATLVGLLVLGITGGRRVLAVLVGAVVLGYVLMPPTVWARLSFTDSSVA